MWSKGVKRRLATEKQDFRPSLGPTDQSPARNVCCVGKPTASLQMPSHLPVAAVSVAPTRHPCDPHSLPDGRCSKPILQEGRLRLEEGESPI